MSQCPICDGKLRLIKYHKLKSPGSVLEKTCAGVNHTLQFHVDYETQDIFKLKCSLDPQYTKFIEFDFINNHCRIICFKDSIANYINIPKMLYPDFPNLIQLKEKVSTYVALS